MQGVLKVAKRVDVKVAKASLKEVLEMCFKGQEGLVWSVMDKVVVVKVREILAQDNVVDDSIIVSGRVLDAEGRPLIGASVRVRGKDIGTTTDSEGRFLLANVKKGAVLEVSYVGHELKLVYVEGQKILEVNLRSRESILDETIVIAYGTTTKRLSTGNIGTVKGEDIQKQPANNLLYALQGRVSGLYVTQSSGLSGSGVTVRVQGQNSLNGGNDPLYVIDGVPFISQTLATATVGEILKKFFIGIISARWKWKSVKLC